MNEDAREPATRHDEPDDDDFVPRSLTSAELGWLWRRMATNDRQLASLLQRYRQDEGMTDQQLAAYLGTDTDGLYRLGLSGPPRSDHYNSDVRAIAAANGIPDFPLRRLLGMVKTAASFRDSPTGGRMLAAARDYDGEHPGPSSAIGESQATYEPNSDEIDPADQGQAGRPRPDQPHEDESQ